MQNYLADIGIIIFFNIYVGIVVTVFFLCVWNFWIKSPFGLFCFIFFFVIDNKLKHI